MHTARRLSVFAGQLLDGLLDLAVVLVAWWSLLYWAFWALGWSLWPAGWVWLVGTVVIVVAMAVLHRRAEDAAEPDVPADQDVPADATAPAGYAALARPLAAVAVVCALGALLATAAWPGHGFVVMWGLTLLGVVAATASSFTGRPSSRTRALVTSAPAHLAAMVMALGVAVLSLYIRLPDLDDPYYVNRSVWIAEHGTSMVRDTMFGPGTYQSPYNGGIPIASIEALVGVLSHMTGLQVGTLTWIVSTFLGAGMATWVLWLLARTWAPRLPLVVAGIAVAFMLMSGDSRLGNFWIARMWQGKVLAIAVLMPLAWVWATRVLASRSRRPVLMLAIGGVAFAGLTSSAVILAPLMSGAMVMAAIFLRSKRLAVGGVLFLVGPVLSGLAVLAFSTNVGGADPALLSGSQTFFRVLGPERVFTALALVGVVVGALVLRTRLAALLVGWVSVAALVMLVPPILHLANDATGAGPILWRVLYCIPIALMVGMLSVARLPGGSAALGRVNRVVAVAVPVLLLVGIVAFGAPLWTTTDHNGPVTLSSGPSWKVEPGALADVRALAGTHPHGVVLLPAHEMRILSMYTTKAYAVDPRDWYSRLLKEPAPDGRYRIALKNFAQSTGPLASVAVVKQALSTLSVTEACLQTNTSPYRAAAQRSRLHASGFGAPRRVGRMTCYSPS